MLVHISAGRTALRMLPAWLRRERVGRQAQYGPYLPTSYHDRNLPPMERLSGGHFIRFGWPLTILSPMSQLSF